MARLVMFCILAVIILGSAIMCVTTKRIMRAATFLLFVLFGVAGIYFLLDYTFLGAAQISIYAGGITMMYIFAIQLVSKRTLQGMQENLKGGRVLAGALAALIGFGRCLAMEFIQEGITSNIICPGYCNTPMVASEARDVRPDDPDSFLKDLAKSLPIGRLGKPEDIGFLVSYLASDEASFMTGQTVVIDGGCTLPELNFEY